MKKTITIGLLLFFGNCLFAQVFNGVDFEGKSFTIDFSSLRKGNSETKNENVNSGSRTTTPEPTSSESQTEAFHTKAYKEFKKGVEAWNRRDWTAAKKAFKTAHLYNPGNSNYTKAWKDAIGYEEWDKGVEEAEKNNWDEAIRRYKLALQAFPEEKILKDNIFGCSYNKTLGLAQKYYNDSDWVNAAVYYNVLWKNFDYKMATVRYSECYTKIGEMKKSEQAFIKFNKKLYEVKNDLPFLNDNW